MRFEKVNVHADARGMVFEPVDAEGLAGKRNVHVVVTRPGEVRGNHRHERAAEVMVVTGESLVRVREGGEVSEVVVPAGQAYRFHFPAGVTHAIRNVGTAETILVAFATEAHDQRQPDTIRDVLI